VPRLRCNVQFPQTLKGVLRIESPVGTKVLEEPYEATTIMRELTLSKYSAYILLNGGLQLGSTASRTLSYGVYVAITPGILNNLRISESATVSTTPGTVITYKNKIRVSVSVS
jgi:hypothetical protein